MSWFMFFFIIQCFNFHIFITKLPKNVDIGDKLPDSVIENIEIITLYCNFYSRKCKI